MERAAEQTDEELAAAESTVVLDYVDLPEVEEADGILGGRRDTTSAACAAPRIGSNGSRRSVDWARLLVEAAATDDATCDLFVQAIRVDDLVVTGLNAELFFETGLEPCAPPFVHVRTRARTARSAISRAPRTTRRVAGTSMRRTPPDLIFQVHPHPVALHRAPSGAPSRARLSRRLAS